MTLSLSILGWNLYLSLGKDEVLVEEDEGEGFSTVAGECIHAEPTPFPLGFTAPSTVWPWEEEE